MPSIAINVRSDFIVHWTGAKSIEKEYGDPESENHKNDQFRRDEYVKRMSSMLTNGMWMNDQIVELNITDKGGDFGTLKWPATCFTEIRLSRTHSHAERYGFLGFGFSREFALKRFGAPVLYVPGSQEWGLGALDIIGPNFHRLLALSSFLEKQTLNTQSMPFPHGMISVRNFPDFTNFINASGLQAFIANSNLQNNSELNAHQLFYLLRSSIMTCAIFVKRMSDDNCTRSFELLDEAEWRIPYTDNMVEKGKILPTNKEKPRGKMLFTADELRVIIFPDDDTRNMAYRVADKDPDISKYLHSPHLITPTVRECMHF